MSKYLISIDGGGTSTEASVYNTDDQSIAIFTFEGSNYHNVGLDMFEKTIVSGLNEIYEALEITADDILGMVLGLAGCDTDIDKEKLLPLILKTGVPKEKTFICNDCEFIMYSLANAPGICVVSGTGSIAFAYDNTDKVIRCGGWGNPLSDLGSGYWVGCQILREYLKFTDDQVPHLPIFDEVEASFGMTRQELIVKCTNISKKEIASVARVVLESAENGDILCRNILEAAAYNLANMCATLFKKLDTENAPSVDIVTTGSIFKNQLLKDAFIDHCEKQANYKNFNFVAPTNSPSESGIQLAIKMFVKN